MRKTVAAVALALVATLSLAGVAQAGEKCTPEDGWTEVTDWLPEQEAPPGDGWYVIDERVVVDEPGGTIVVTEAQHYSFTGGPQEGEPTTVPPGDDWQANTSQEPHLNNPNVTWVDGFGVGLHYTSNGGSGLADYFYFQPEVTEEVPPLTHTEYKFARDHEGVECEEPPKPSDDPKPPPPGDDKTPPVKDYPDLAETGFSAGAAGVAAGLLTALGLGSLYFARRRSAG